MLAIANILVGTEAAPVDSARYAAWKEAVLDAAILAGSAMATIILYAGFDNFAVDPARALFSSLSPSLVLFFASLKASFRVRDPAKV